jgi:hypothetical protein
MSEVKKEANVTRNKRRPFGVPQSKLSISKQLEGYHYRWINDSPGRIAQALEGAYVFVTPDEVGRDSRDGDVDKVRELAGTNKDGSAMYAYLMRLPLEYYYEDKKIATDYLNEIDSAIKGGRINQTAADKRYVPREGISYKTK